MTAYPGPNLNPDDAGPIVLRPMGLPITAGCDTAWNRTRVCSDAPSTDMQCFIPLPHSGALVGIKTPKISLSMYILLRSIGCSVLAHHITDGVIPKHPSAAVNLLITETVER